MNGNSAAGLIIAAPSSGSGKTLLTLGILRALKQQGHAVSSVKAGPDYIDPAFHAAATGRACENLDPWAMRTATRCDVLRRAASSSDIVICEGVMGLFDGATATTGSTADVASWTGWPVILVVDVRAQAASAAAIVRGFVGHRKDVSIAGVIFNRVGSDRHADVLREAMVRTLAHIPVLGCVPRNDDLKLPGRHLGLVQAGEHPDLENFLDAAAYHVRDHLDLHRLMSLAKVSGVRAKSGSEAAFPPLGQRIAIARDRAFAFCYAHLLQAWQQAGAELSFFSPLADEAPSADSDAVFLPGGYPELHGSALALADTFRKGLRRATDSNIPVYGECGGYMVLGEGLIDAKGTEYAMTGLLPLTTSFADRSLHLGYRRVESRADSPLGSIGSVFYGHEFHYASVVREDAGLALFHAEDARSTDLGPMGMVQGSVAGSYFHLIDRAGD